MLKKKNKELAGESKKSEDIIMESDFEKRFVNSINKYKEKIYYDLFIDKAKK